MKKEKLLFDNLVNIGEKRIKGKLYCSPEDFIVREIPLNKSSIGDSAFELLDFPPGQEDKFVICTLVKKGISDFRVFEELSDFLGIQCEDIGYHGLKDTFGVTLQSISLPSSVYLENFDRLKNKKFKNFFLKSARFSGAPCRLREIWGNNFVVKVSDFENPEGEIRKILEKFIHENKKLPNFYGHQRFGIRQNGHLLGKSLIKRDFEEALRLFCTDSANEPKEISCLRAKLSKIWGSWKESYDAVKQNPYFFYEKKIFQHLLENAGDYEGAVRKLSLSNFFVNSYSSYLFNQTLKNLISKGLEPDYLPVIGYAVNLNNEKIRGEYDKILAGEGVSVNDFKNEFNKHLSYPGRIKEAFYRAENFDFKIDNSSLILEFSLPMGTYANLFLENLFENKLQNQKLE